LWSIDDNARTLRLLLSIWLSSSTATEAASAASESIHATVTSWRYNFALKNIAAK